MNTDKLKYLIEVEKMQSVSKAAENLHISQSAVSQTISEFENLLEDKLFVRKNQLTLPTEKGKMLLDKARNVLKEVQAFERELYASSIEKEIRVGTYPGFMPNFVSSISTFKDEEKDTSIFITENNNLSNIDLLREQRIEAAFCFWTEDFTHDYPDLIFTPMTKGKFVLCINTDSEYSHQEFITHKELKNLPLILYEDILIQNFISEYERTFDTLNILFTSNEADSARNALLKNLGVLIGPDFTFVSDPHIREGRLKTLNVKEFENTELTLGWVTLKTPKLHKKTQQFIDYFIYENDFKNE